MREFQGKVAVITGAASGIGRAIAERCAREGMRVVLADVEKPALEQTAAQMEAAGATVLPVVTDVSKLADMESLAGRTFDTFGGVHLLVNNAGVGAGSYAWETSTKDWTWVLGVNLWGVIHGLQLFVPRMLAQGEEGHIVNTASAAGLIAYHLSAPYLVTKHAVVALSEKLYYDLAMSGAKVKASVLCPGWVRTRIMDGERNRPPELANDRERAPTPAEEKAVEAYRQACETGMPPEAVADLVFDAIREERFYILTHPDFAPFVQARMAGILRVGHPVDLPGMT
jgi:NAD(P)-dependent dehydrogenase (short-subunit alcohol dehydrogenase family)